MVISGVNSLGEKEEVELDGIEISFWQSIACDTLKLIFNNPDPVDGCAKQADQLTYEFHRRYIISNSNTKPPRPTRSPVRIR